jgi:hypothetical protein
LRFRALQRWKIVPGNANAAPRLESLPAFSPTGLLCAAAREEELVIFHQDGSRFLRTNSPLRSGRVFADGKK